MIRRLALHVCPVPGCAKIGGQSCPVHHKPMVREVYAHEPHDPERQKLRDQVAGLKDPKMRSTFERVGKDMGIL